MKNYKKGTKKAMKYESLFMAVSWASITGLAIIHLIINLS